MENSFEIISYVGAKPLLFGMTRGQVEAIVGPPITKTTDDLGETEASYKSFNIQYSKQDKSLVEVGFSKSAGVKIHGLDLFNDPKAFLHLLREDSCPYESFGFIILLDLGITLTGFHDGDPNQLAITAFARGRWDHLKSDFKKFKIP
ncbi:MAG TPA: hypothetical protein VH280_06965 [Verrucomicrobiae bacterium]|jgi:hypothetical protein|nr:hypothetical protein [Verrucomicrobiae bacterium]